LISGAGFVSAAGSTLVSAGFAAAAAKTRFSSTGASALDGGTALISGFFFAGTLGAGFAPFALLLAVRAAFDTTAAVFARACFAEFAFFTGRLAAETDFLL
jgi:hypothetical protein